MTWQQTLDFLYSQLPMYHRIGPAAIKKDLTNIRWLCDQLDQPQQSFASIHVAGTNGKGSTSHMIASIFQAAGYNVGLYTSPHYIDFRERIKINGKSIGRNEVIRFVEKYRQDWPLIGPSFFEITVAMAFDHFRRHKVDLAVIETGLGGRLDSTNIITPMLSVITNIGYDHMQMLGDTLEEIAYEKAGIIKLRVPVVIGEWNRTTSIIFKKQAHLAKAPIHFASRHVRCKPVNATYLKQTFSARMGSARNTELFSSDLIGTYQLKNMTTVLEAMWCWNKYYPKQKVTYASIRKGLAAVKQSTHIMGRWMVLEQKPLVIADAAHNEHGIKAIIPGIRQIRCPQKHFVLGFVNDKEIQQLLKHFPKRSKYYWCSPDVPRGKPADDTRAIGHQLQLDGQSYKNVNAAWKAAKAAAGSRDFIFIGGSSYVVGEFLAAVKYKTDA